MPEEQIIEELPAGPPEGGGGGRPWPPRPGVAELPAFPPYGFAREAVTELFRLRDRVHALETQMLAARVYGGSFGGGYVPPRYWPNELPPFEAFYRTGFSGELKGPVLGAGADQLIALLEALLATLRPNPNPAEIPAEYPQR
jgi:hypothetical protein